MKIPGPALLVLAIVSLATPALADIVRTAGTTNDRILRLPRASRHAFAGKWVRYDPGHPSDATDRRQFWTSFRAHKRRVLARLEEGGYSEALLDAIHELARLRATTIGPRSRAEHFNGREGTSWGAQQETWAEQIEGHDVGGRHGGWRRFSDELALHGTRAEATGKQHQIKLVVRPDDKDGTRGIAMLRRIDHFSTAAGLPVVREHVREERPRADGFVAVEEYQLDTIGGAPAVRTELGRYLARPRANPDVVVLGAAPSSERPW